MFQDLWLKKNLYNLFLANAVQLRVQDKNTKGYVNRVGIIFLMSPISNSGDLYIAENDL